MRYPYNPTGKETGEEYYWHHQQQLQHSALTFQASLKALRSTPPRLQEEVNAEKRELTSILQQESSCLGKKGNQDTKSSKSTCQDNPHVDNKPQILANTVLPLAWNKKQIKNLNFEPKKQLKIILCFTGKPVIKDHHLFIQNNQAELSLNTGKQSKQQTRDFTQAIKQWLLNKGIHLQQFLLNGVKQ